MQWHRLDNDKTEVFLNAIKGMGAGSLFTMQSSEAHCMRLPFTENILFFRIKNNMSMPSFTMDFLGDGTNFYYIDGTSVPLERAFTSADLDIDRFNIASYLQFYFFVVIQEDGEIYPVFERAPIPDIDDQNIHATRQSIPNNAYIFDIKEKEEGHFEVECTLFYDGGLMTGTLSVTPTGRVSIKGLKPLFMDTHSTFSEASKDQIT